MARDDIVGAPPVEVGQDEHVLTNLWVRAEREGDADTDLLSWPLENGGWDSLTVAAVAQRVREIAAGLVASGIEPGDRVAIMSPTRIEWVLADLAVLAAGAVTVPIYETSSEDQCAYILADAGPRLAFVADDDLARTLDQANSGRARSKAASGLGEVVSFDQGGLDELASRGAGEDLDEVERRVDALTGEQLAGIVYTSGTTGDPKGCPITHRNLIWTARQAQRHLDGVIGPDDTTLLFLPMAHVFCRVVQMVCLDLGVQVGFARSIDDLSDDLGSFQPSFLLAVPRVFEKVFRSAQRQATGPRAKLFNLAVRVGRAWSRAEQPGPHLRFGRTVADRLVYAKLRAGVGGRVRLAVSGGAPLDPDLAHFFAAAGIPILEGYGLTETTAPAAVNLPSDLRIGSVGRPLPGVSVRVADDGELLVGGESVISGYHSNDEATRESFTDGWFHTGDLGSIDDDGFVWVEGRKKELIVTAGGKNVSPGPLEQQLTAHPLVANAMVVGDQRPFLAALVTVDPEELERKGDSASMASADSEWVRDEVAEAVEAANDAVSKAESIREFVILDRDFTVEDGELTQTQKLRREVIAEHFEDEIESIYAEVS